MQTEAAVRAYLADLEAILAKPCPCCGQPGGGPMCGQYERRYSAASLMMQNVAFASWVLGENPNFDRLVESTAALARQE